MIYRFLNLISLDVAVGAMISAAMFAGIFNVNVRLQGFLALGLTVWGIYTADHLLDARRIKGEASTMRHSIHQRYFKFFVVLLVLIAAADGVAIAMVRRPVLYSGLALAALVLVYLFVQERLKAFKEAVIAILYSAGVLLPGLSLMQQELSASQLMMLLIFILTTFINLILFSWFEFDQDRTNEQGSFAVLLGKEVTRKFLVMLFLIQAILVSGSFLVAGYSFAKFILSAMNVILLVLFLAPSRFQSADRYRMWGDAIFLIPIVYLLM